MNSDLESYLTVALKRLEKAYQEIVKSKGYNEESEKLKILLELVKEQGNHENTSSATR